MIIQSEGQETPGRERAWLAHFMGDTVLVRHYVIDLSEGEDLDDKPDTHSLTMAEWQERHGDYGLTLDGQPAS